MDKLQAFCRELRKRKRTVKDIEPRTWSEDDLLEGKLTKAFVFILKTRGASGLIILAALCVGISMIASRI